MSVRDGLLALLNEQPRYGYQLKTSFETATGGVWPLNVGQVYKTLDRLERDGLVEASDDDGQRSYRITPDGVAELGAWWDATPGDEPPPRDELVLKVLLAIAVDRENALDVVTRQRAAVMSLLQQRRRTPKVPDHRRDPLAATLVADALVVRAEADLRWLDLCEERLTHLDDDAPPARPGRTARGGAGR